MEKYASNVIERCIDISEDIILKAYIDEICDGNSILGIIFNNIKDIMKNSYGNFVVQTALRIARRDNKKKLEENVAKNIDRLGEKKIIDKWRDILYKSENNYESPPRKRKESHKINKKPAFDSASNGSHGSHSSLSNINGQFMIAGQPNYVQSNIHLSNNPNFVQPNFLFYSDQLPGKLSPQHQKNSLFKKFKNEPECQREEYNQDYQVEDNQSIIKRKEGNPKDFHLQFEGIFPKFII